MYAAHNSHPLRRHCSTLRIRYIRPHCVYTAQATTSILDVDELVTTFVSAEVREYVRVLVSEWVVK